MRGALVPIEGKEISGQQRQPSSQIEFVNRLVHRFGVPEGDEFVLDLPLCPLRSIWAPNGLES